MPSVFIPPPYRGPTRGESEVAVSASTVRECLQAVESRYPGFGELVFAADGGLPRYVKLFLNGEVLDPRDLDRGVSEGDAVEVMAAIAGG